MNVEMDGYTLKQAAQILGVSKNTVKYRMKKIPVEEITTAADGRIILSPAAMDILMENQPADFEKRTSTSKEPPKTTINHQENQTKTTINHEEPVLTEQKPVYTEQKPVYTTQEPVLTGQNHEKPRKEPVEEPPKEPDTTAQYIASLERQNAFLMAQLQEKDLHIAELTATLKRAQDNIAIAQQVQAGVLQNRYLSDGSEPATIDQEPKKVSFWHRFFGI